MPDKGLKEVTDPNILSQLNGSKSELKPVNDPSLLSQLNAPVISPQKVTDAEKKSAQRLGVSNVKLELLQGVPDYQYADDKQTVEQHRKGAEEVHGKEKEIKHNQNLLEAYRREGENTTKLYNKVVQTQAYLKHLALNNKSDEYNKVMEDYSSQFGGEKPEEHLAKLNEMKDLYLQKAQNTGKILEKLLPAKNTDYIEGTIKEFGNGTANLFEAMDGASKFIADHTGLSHGGVFKDVADGIRNGLKSAEDMPDDLGGKVLGGIAQSVPLVLQTVAMPELDFLDVPLGVGANAFKMSYKLPTALAFNNAGEAYRAKGDEMKALGAGVEGVVSGTVLGALGYPTQKVMGLVGELGGNKALSATAGALASGTGFGGFNVAQKYISTGNADSKDFLEGFGQGFVMSTPEILKSFAEKADNKANAAIMNAHPETIKDVNNVKQSPVELRGEADRLMEEVGKETNPVKKMEKLISANSLNQIADIKAKTENILANPKAYVEAIEKRTDIDEGVKKKQVEHINQIVQDNDGKEIMGKMFADQIREKQSQIDYNNRMEKDEVKKASKNRLLEDEIKNLNGEMDKLYKEKPKKEKVSKEKNTNFVKDELPKSIPQGEHGEIPEGDNRNEEVASQLRRRIEKAHKDAGIEDVAGKDLRQIDNKVAFDFAKETNTWIGDFDSLGKRFAGGNENTIVFDESKQKLYKSNNLSNTNSLDKFLEKIKLHNELFPNTTYKFEGFAGVENIGGGRPYAEPVYSQDFIKGTIDATEQEISDYMKNLGFEKTGDGRFKKGNIEAWDLKSKNVLKDKDGNIYVIDGEFKQAKPDVLPKEKLTEENQKAVDEGFDNITHKINTLNKELGTEKKNIQEFTPEEIQKGTPTPRSTKGRKKTISELTERELASVEGALARKDAAKLVLNKPKESAKAEIKEKVTELKEESGSALLVKQKQKLVGDLHKVEDIVIGEDYAKNKADILAREDLNDKEKNMQIQQLHNTSNDVALADATKRLEDAGYVVKNGKVRVKIYKDGEVNVGDIRGAIETAENEFPTKTAKPENIRTGNRMPGLTSMVGTESLESAKQSLQDSADNLETAKKSGNKNQIDTYEKQLAIDKEAYQQVSRSHKNNQESVKETEDMIKSGKVDSKYAVERILNLPKLKSEVAKMEGKEVFEENPNYQLAKTSLEKLISEAEKEHEEFIQSKGLRKADGSLKRSISQGDERRLTGQTNEISELKTDLENVNKELKSTESRKQEANNQIADAVDKIVTKMGGKKNITPEERTTLIADLKQLLDGIVKRTGVSLEEAYKYAIDHFTKKASLTDEDLKVIKKGIFSESKEESTIIGASHGALGDIAKKMGLDQPERGQRLTPEEQINRGRELLRGGANVEQLAKDFKNDKLVNEDRISLARAHQEVLAKTLDKAYEKNGENSSEYKDAQNELNKWNKEIIKPMGSEAGHAFASLQGGIDIDHDSFVQLKSAAEEKGGKPLTEKQTEEAKALSEENKKLKSYLEGAEKKLTDLLNKSIEEEKPAPKNIKQKSKQVADFIRKGKLSRPDVFSSATPASLVWDGALEVAAKTIETGGTIAQAIADGMSHIKASKWYKDFDKKEDAEKAFENYIKKGQESKEDIHTRFADKTDAKFETKDVKDIWAYAKENYVDKGRSYEEMLKGVATDTGLQTWQIREALAQPKGARIITDEIYRKQDARKKALAKSKEWVETTHNSKLKEFINNTPSFFFKLKTFGHGTVAPITHAGMNLFRPTEWGKYFKFMANGYKYAFVGLGEAGEARYLQAMEDLKNKPNYILARRSGLANDPDSKYDDYQKGKNFFGKLGLAGDRGFNALKSYRQDLFDMYYDKLSVVEKADPNTAKEIAKLVNHATGTSEVNFPKWVNTAFFAPKLEASRWQGLITDPAKATKTFVNWNKATAPEKVQAKIVAKRAGEIISTYGGLLAMNQAILTLSGSDDKINFTNPLKSDWMKFKASGKTIDVSGGVRSSIAFVGNLMNEIYTGYTGNKKELWKKPEEKELVSIGTQLRYKSSPFAGILWDLATSTDAMGRPLPFSNVKPKKGDTPYTIQSYLLNQTAPIPVSAGIRATIESMKENGMTEVQIKDILDGIFTGIVEGASGAKLQVAKPANQVRQNNYSQLMNRNKVLSR